MGILAAMAMVVFLLGFGVGLWGKFQARREISKGMSENVEGLRQNRYVDLGALMREDGMNHLRGMESWQAQGHETRCGLFRMSSCNLGEAPLTPWVTAKSASEDGFGNLNETMDEAAADEMRPPQLR